MVTQRPACALYSCPDFELKPPVRVPDDTVALMAGAGFLLWVWAWAIKKKNFSLGVDILG